MAKMNNHIQLNNDKLLVDKPHTTKSHYQTIRKNSSRDSTSCFEVIPYPKTFHQELVSYYESQTQISSLTKLMVLIYKLHNRPLVLPQKHTIYLLVGTLDHFSEERKIFLFLTLNGKSHLPLLVEGCTSMLNLTTSLILLLR